MASRTSQPVGGVSLRPLIWLFHLALPLAGLWLLLAQPQLDAVWEDHVAHFWLVLGTALLTLGLAVLVGLAADRHDDLRLLLVVLGFVTAAGFLALHAVATPAVVVDHPNAAFNLATPLGVALAGAWAVAASLDFGLETARRLLDRRAALFGLAAATLVAWALLSLVPGSPLLEPVPPDRTRFLLRAIAAVGIALYAIATFRSIVRFRGRPSIVLLSIITAQILLAESLVAMAEAPNWHASWWEWHILMAIAFGYIAYASHVQYRREGTTTTLFASISMAETVRRLRQSYAAALDQLVEAFESAGQEERTREDRAEAVRAATTRLEDELGLSEGQTAVLEEAATALADERRMHRQVERLFRSYLSPEVVRSLLEDPGRAGLGGRETEVTVLFGDLRGYTAFSEGASPEAVVELLNAYYGAIVPLILAEGGTVTQFIGDAIMAVFNAPVPQADHPRHAARAALAMQAAVDALAAEGAGRPRFRVGLATGPALVGNVGAAEVRTFSAIGETTNLAARLQTFAEVGRVVVSATTAARLGDGARLRPLGGVDLKGFSGPVAAFELLGLEV